MKKFLFLCAFFTVFIFNAQKKTNKSATDCSSYLEDLIKINAFTWFKNVNEYKIKNYESHEALDTEVKAALQEYYLKLSLFYLKKANEIHNTDREKFEIYSKKADVLHKKATALLDLDIDLISKELGILIYTTNYYIKGDGVTKEYSSNFYFNSKCKDFSADILSRYMIENIEKK